MRCKLPEVKTLRWESHRCVELLSAHRGVIEPLEVDHEQPGKTVKSDVLFNVDRLLTALTFVASIDDLLHINKLLHAVFQ